MTDQQPRLFQIWLDASDGSIATYDGVQWPDGTADVHYRHRRPDGVQWSPESLAETIHGKLARIEAGRDALAVIDQAEAAIERVRGIHRHVECVNVRCEEGGWCIGCDPTGSDNCSEHPWPCQTIQALEQP